MCSAKNYLTQIKIPTVVITAKDDPFVKYEDYDRVLHSEYVLLHIEKSGGHLGYLTRKGVGCGRWLDVALGYYLATMGQTKVQ